MLHEYDPVEEDEFVLRRVHRNHCDPNLANLIRSGAFTPNQNDLTGISVFRACLVQPTETLTSIEPSRAKEYYVVRLAVRDLRALGLTVEPDPDSNGPPGHAIVRELNRADYVANKSHWRFVLLKLAQLASADIVHRPSGP